MEIYSFKIIILSFLLSLLYVPLVTPSNEAAIEIKLYTFNINITS